MVELVVNWNWDYGIDEIGTNVLIDYESSLRS